MEKLQKKIRYLARIVLEAQTAISLKSGGQGALVDGIVALDWNFLPYLPATSLAGVFHHSLLQQLEEAELSLEEKETIKEAIVHFVGGSQISWSKEDQAEVQTNYGSSLIFSDALLCGANHQVFQVPTTDFGTDKAYFQQQQHLPIRDHVRLNHRGVSVAQAKFDEEIVPKGTRFKLEVEYAASDLPQDDTNWKRLKHFFEKPIRLGGGTRNGLGKLQTISWEARKFDLAKTDDFLDWMKVTVDLNTPIVGTEIKTPVVADLNTGWQKRTFQVRPKDFFIFASEATGKLADKTIKKEAVVQWLENKNPHLDYSNPPLLIPGTSIKGALAHRAVFHYNQQHKITVESELQKAYEKEKVTLQERLDKGESKETIRNELKEVVERIKKSVKENFSTENHPAKVALFGYAKEGDSTAQEGQIGNIIIEDIYRPAADFSTKVFDHVAIDPFTGGSEEGALYNEEVAWLKKDTPPITITIWIKDGIEEAAQKAFFTAIEDVKTGRLALGGLSNRGHGRFYEPQQPTI